MIRILLFLLASALFVASSPDLHAQSAEPGPATDARAAMARLSHLAGTWEGEARYQAGPDETHVIHQRERIEPALEGTLLLIEGTGTAEGGEVVHHAFGVIEHDPARGGYRMNAWLADGRSVDAAAELTDGGLSWGFETPDGARIRYRAASDGESWTETGERSVDGETWMPFFTMTLHRTGPAPAAPAESR